MDEARWPWILLVPTREGVTELHQLGGDERRALFEAIATASEAMQRATACRSVNVAALGNVVAALHVHVVARDEGDPNWPAPVWGFGTRVPRTDPSSSTEALPPFAIAVRDALGAR